MDTIKKLFSNPIVMLVVGLLIGTFFGLVILGWWLMPVEWVDASIADLRYDAKVEILRTCIDAYGYNGDAAKAQDCYAALGEDGPAALEEIVTDPGAQDPRLIAGFGTIVLGETVVVTPAVQGAESPVEAYPGSETAAEEVPQGETAAGSSNTTLTVVLLLGLLAIGVLAGLFYWRSRRSSPKTEAEFTGTQTEVGESKAVASMPEDEAYSAPITRSMANYQIGNDMFDEIYPIDYNGAYMGEFGVSIAEFIGVGGPKKVTAFEVWLFDRETSHITKVLMSGQTYSDPSKRQKLMVRGDPVLAEPGAEIILESKSLRLVAKVVDMEYGNGNLPPETYFDQFRLDLTVSHI
jgi:hypothetical protein